MPSNMKFLDKWKPIHKKGFLTYILSYSLPVIIPCILYIIYLDISRPISSETMREIIWGNVFTLSVLVVSLIIRWVNGEKKYKEIIEAGGDSIERNFR